MDIVLEKTLSVAGLGLQAEQTEAHSRTGFSSQKIQYVAGETLWFKPFTISAGWKFSF